MADGSVTQTAYPSALAAGGEARTGREFSLAFVCTGNRFRSPLAEALVRQAAAGVPLAVTSVGLVELGSQPALEEAVELGRRLGVNLLGHRTRSLRTTALAETDLVLGFERVHLAAAVVEGGVPLSRVFTLPDFVELLADLHLPRLPPVERARRAVVAADRLRSRSRAVTVNELGDPLGGPPRLYRRAAKQVAALAVEAAGGLFG
jgi:protein-tyrosine phosphatase